MTSRGLQSCDASRPGHSALRTRDWAQDRRSSRGWSSASTRQACNLLPWCHGRVTVRHTLTHQVSRTCIVSITNKALHQQCTPRTARADTHHLAMWYDYTLPSMANQCHLRRHRWSVAAGVDAHASTHATAPNCTMTHAHATAPNCTMTHAHATATAAWRMHARLHQTAAWRPRDRDTNAEGGTTWRRHLAAAMNPTPRLRRCASSVAAAPRRRL